MIKQKKINILDIIYPHLQKHESHLCKVTYPNEHFIYIKQQDDWIVIEKEDASDNIIIRPLPLVGLPKNDEYIISSTSPEFLDNLDAIINELIREFFDSFMTRHS